MKTKLYSGAFLKARINHDVGTITNFSSIMQMPLEEMKAKIQSEQFFDVGEIAKAIEVLNITTGSECSLLFFLHRKDEPRTHYNLYKVILDNDIPPVKVALALGISLESLFKKISGSIDFNWDEVITVKEKFFPEYSLGYLFERGVTA